MREARKGFAWVDLTSGKPFTATEDGKARATVEGQILCELPINADGNKEWLAHYGTKVATILSDGSEEAKTLKGVSAAVFRFNRTNARERLRGMLRENPSLSLEQLQEIALSGGLAPGQRVTRKAPEASAEKLAQLEGQALQDYLASIGVTIT